MILENYLWGRLPCSLKLFWDIFHLEDGPHATTATPKRGLEHDWDAMSLAELDGFLNIYIKKWCHEFNSLSVKFRRKNCYVTEKSIGWGFGYCTSNENENFTSAVLIAESVPGMMGSPAFVAAIRAATLSPILKRKITYRVRDFHDIEWANPIIQILFKTRLLLFRISS